MRASLVQTGRLTSLVNLNLHMKCTGVRPLLDESREKEEVIDGLEAENTDTASLTGSVDLASLIGQSGLVPG
jgi:hypothetical protein